jgi:hypothetical protein
VTEAGGGLTSTLVYFAFVVGDSAASGLFTPVLILSTPALHAVTVTAMVTMIFDTTASKGAVALVGMLVPGTTPAFDACVVWVALSRTIFDEVMLVLLMP